MKKRIFFISRQPEIDHLGAFIFFNSKDYENYIFARDDDKQLESYNLKALFENGYAKKIKRVDFKNYSFYYYPIIFLVKILKPYMRIIFKKNYYLRVSYVNNFLGKILSNNFLNKFKNVDIFLDHNNSTRSKDLLLERLLVNAKRIVALPHSYHYAKNRKKYLKAFRSYQKCWANEIYVYGNYHLNQFEEFLPKSIKKKILFPYKFQKEWFYFKLNYFRKFRSQKLKELNNLNLKKKNVVVYLDSPFIQKEFSEKRKELLNALNKTYFVIHVPHSRNYRPSIKNNCFIWREDICELIDRYDNFVGIFTTLSIDLSQFNKLYITCSFLRESDYRCYDEEIGATKVAENQEEVFKLLKSKPNPKAQEKFLKEINLEDIKG